MVSAPLPARGGVLAILVCLGVLLGSAAPLAGARTIPTAQRVVVSSPADRTSAVVRLRVWSNTLGFLGGQAAGREAIPGQNPWLRSAVGYGLVKIEYDPEADALYIQIREAHADDNIDIEEGVIVDIDENKHIVGLEILDASKRLSPSDLSSIIIQKLPLESTIP